MSFTLQSSEECADHSFVEYRMVGAHKGEYCRNCGKWLRWVPQDMTPERAKSILMPFGKHKGTRLGEIDSGYLRWFYEKSGDGGIAKACRVILEDRNEPL